MQGSGTLNQHAVTFPPERRFIAVRDGRQTLCILNWIEHSSSAHFTSAWLTCTEKNLSLMEQAKFEANFGC